MMRTRKSMVKSGSWKTEARCFLSLHYNSEASRRALLYQHCSPRRQEASSLAPQERIYFWLHGFQLYWTIPGGKGWCEAILRTILHLKTGQ